ncbi:hypothetical protein EYF80_062847 [Liparis tanakae]|uniref:Uncharacterized protein n=1 Tax=Liparis tanakae TaxID=230148 RepID=A0A4Z2EEN7_9TELE|nr:hypothetical protein EYF80_062847 [Liparis tanakae]
MKSKNPEVSLALVSCWATGDDRKSLPKWDLIINGQVIVAFLWHNKMPVKYGRYAFPSQTVSNCANPKDPYQVIFHPVLPDARVDYPSNFKRFEIPKFAFAKDNFSRQVICTTN